MISQMAMEDIAALRTDGIDVPPREVVRLNVLGLRVERGPDSPDVFGAPRVAFLGDVVLREPSLGSDMWLRQTADAFNLDDDAQTWFALRVLSCAVPWRELPDPTRPRAVRKDVERTLRELSDFTIRQVENALSWCIDGNLAETGENPPHRRAEADGADDCADAAVGVDGRRRGDGARTEADGGEEGADGGVRGEAGVVRLGVDAVAEEVVLGDVAEEGEVGAAVRADGEGAGVADEFGEEAEEVEQAEREKRPEGARVAPEAAPAGCLLRGHVYLPEEKVMRGSISM